LKHWIRLSHNDQFKISRSPRMTPLRQRMIEDMCLTERNSFFGLGIVGRTVTGF
jgi:hypothetical protein